MRHLLLSIMLCIVSYTFTSCQTKVVSVIPSSHLTIRFLAVGQGDSILITCPDQNTHILIDAGNSDVEYPGSEALFKTAIENYIGNKVIEYAISTHPHVDHIFGFKWLSSSTSDFRVKTFIDNGANTNDSNLAKDLRTAFAKSLSTYINLRTQPITQLSICHNRNNEIVNLELLRLSDKAEKHLSCPDNLNDCSIVTRLTFGKNSVLLAADTTTSWEQIAMLEFSDSLKSNILKVGHHGVESTGLDFLKLVSPDYAIISVGLPGIGTTEKYGYPSPEVIANLNHYFQSKFPIAKEQYTQLKVCEKLAGASTCNWMEIHSHPRILTTANLGTIEFTIDSKSVSNKASP